MINTIVKNLLLGLLCCVSFAATAQTMVGDWSAKGADENGNPMTFKVSLKADGTYTVDFGADGTVEIEGKYTIAGNQMTIEDTGGPAACNAGKGVYTFELTETTNTLTLVSDPCEGRGGPDGKIMFTRL